MSVHFHLCVKYHYGRESDLVNVIDDHVASGVNAMQRLHNDVPRKCSVFGLPVFL